MPHRITTFNDSENAGLAADIQLGNEIVKHFCADSKKIDAQFLDQAFSGWCKNQTSFSREQIAKGLGSLLGELIKKDFNFSWKMVEDDLGNEAALLDEISGSIVFPVNTVWKRIDPEVIAEPFFALMYQTIQLHLNQQKRK